MKPLYVFLEQQSEDRKESRVHLKSCSLESLQVPAVVCSLELSAASDVHCRTTSPNRVKQQKAAARSDRWNVVVPPAKELNKYQTTVISTEQQPERWRVKIGGKWCWIRRKI